MTNYKKFPFTVVNNYMADVLATENIMSKTLSIGGKQQPTIVPSAQNPELADSGATATERQSPFIIYSFELDDDDTPEWYECETMNYIIYAPSVSKIMEIIYCMRDLFGRDYSSADEINDWQRAQNPGQELYFDFLGTSWKTLAGPEAMRSEGGRYAAMISVHYIYTYPVITKANGQVGRRV